MLITAIRNRTRMPQLGRPRRRFSVKNDLPMLLLYVMAFSTLGLALNSGALAALFSPWVFLPVLLVIMFIRGVPQWFLLAWPTFLDNSFSVPCFCVLLYHNTIKHTYVEKLQIFYPTLTHLSHSSSLFNQKYSIFLFLYDHFLFHIFWEIFKIRRTFGSKMLDSINF